MKMGQMIINWDQFSSKSVHYFSLFFTVFCLSLFSSCGGGGGGGSAPPVVSTPSQPLSSLPTGQEYQAQSGLQQIGVASALQRGWQGQNVKAGIVDSGVASTHSEFTAALRGGGDVDAADIQNPVAVVGNKPFAPAHGATHRRQLPRRQPARRILQPQKIKSLSC